MVNRWKMGLLIVLMVFVGSISSLLVWFGMNIGTALYNDHQKIQQMFPVVVQLAQERQMTQEQPPQTEKNKEEQSEKKKR